MDFQITEAQWNAFLVFLPTISGIAASIGLIISAITLRKNNETRELHITENIVSDLKNLEREFLEKYAHKDETERRKWDILFFNSIEWLCFLINERKIRDKKIIYFFKDGLIAWYEDILVKHYSKEELDDQKIFPEFKKLYHELKKKT